MKYQLKRKKKGIIVACIAAGVVVIAAGTGFFIVKSKKSIAAMPAQAMTTQVSKGTIATTVTGTGTLQADQAEAVSLPEGIEVKEVLVEAGDTVQKGDTLATLDQASVLKKLKEVQEEQADVDEELEDASDETEDASVTTNVSGRVKKIYGAEGDTVSDVMKNKGALIVLSLDGKMAVDMENILGLEKGDQVTVTLSDGSEKEGTVASIEKDTCTVTLTDNGTDVEEEVSVRDADDRKLGTGKLYIYRPLEIMGTAGTISDIKVSENEKVRAGTTLMTLTDMPESMEYQELLSKRESLADDIRELTELASDGALKASFEGTVQTVNVTGDSTVTKSTDSGNTSGSGNAAGSTVGNAGGITNTSCVVLTSTAQTEKTATVTSITDMNSLFQELAIAVPVSGETPKNAISQTGQYAGTVSWSPAGDTFAEKTAYTATVVLKAAEGFQFVIPDQTALAYPGAAQTQWEIAEQCEQNTLKLVLTFPETAAAETEAQTEEKTQPQTQPQTEQQQSQTQAQTEEKKQPESQQPQTEEKQQPQTEEKQQPQTEEKQQNTEKTPSAANAGNTGNTGNTGTMASAGGSGGSSLGGSVSNSGSQSAASSASGNTTDSSSTNAESEGITAFTISPDEDMLLSVNIDELDILSIKEGQKAKVTLDALEDQTFEGELTKINHTASTSGGVTKYTVEITIPKEQSMLTGMNASAVITIESKEDVLLVPADAIQERRGVSYVYTEQSEDGSLSGEVEVETGLSDGNQVEITSGLTEGQTIYYQKMEVSGSSNADMEKMMQKMMNGNGGQKGNWGGQAPSDRQAPGGMPGGAAPSN